MKRTVPLLITAVVGFVLIVSYFIPATEGWGEVAAVWFDILAGIAFILGGGNLLTVHLRKISDRAAGWGYSFVTLTAFLVTLWVGLGKVGTPPSAELEHYGETFASLPLAAFPEGQTARVTGTVPREPHDTMLPASVRRQLHEQDGTLEFRGWMRPNQRQDLIAYKNQLDWQCTVERLFDESQPPAALRGKVAYYSDYQALSYRGSMDDSDRLALLAMSDDSRWQSAVEEIYQQSRRTTSITVDRLPENFEIPESLQDDVTFDTATRQLTIQGPMSPAQRDALADQFPRAKPLFGEHRRAFLEELERRGETLTVVVDDDGEVIGGQLPEFNRQMDGPVSPVQIEIGLNSAGQAPEFPKTACEMLEERETGETEIEPTRTMGEDLKLSDEQKALIEAFLADPDMTIGELSEQLGEAGPFTDAQDQALRSMWANNLTIGERNRRLTFKLLEDGPLTEEQRDFLLDDYREQYAWRSQVGELFVASHVPKHEWSGAYRTQGTPFWWLYEYAFKPLTATMFAMLAFYVASAAFRAFRAKNVEAILLLGTAFIILLGRTFAGVLLTDWLPEALSGLRIENLTVTIMSVFNTTGNRAIMIGIALGIASTSLKVLLGVDRSYLGSRDE
jgi:hypothetical protein